MTRLILAAVASLALVSACASAEQYEWQKDGMMEHKQEAVKEAYECYRDTMQIYSGKLGEGQGFVTPSNAERFAYVCMTSKGWRWTRVS